MSHELPFIYLYAGNDTLSNSLTPTNIVENYIDPSEAKLSLYGEMVFEAIFRAGSNGYVSYVDLYNETTSEILTTFTMNPSSTAATFFSSSELPLPTGPTMYSVRAYTSNVGVSCRLRMARLRLIKK